MSNLFLTILLLNFELIYCIKSCQNSFKNRPQYVLIKSNAKSLKTVIARKKVLNVEKCKEFAESKQGLAFNFGPRNSEDGLSTESDLYKVNCVILDCPEIDNFKALQEAKGVKYYSLYTNWMSVNNKSTSGSLSCIPRVGLFMFFENHLNFTNARFSCQKINGTLAHVVSEKRTEGLATVVGNSPTYVGLSSQTEKRNWKNEFDEPLECFDYRAWSYGEPTHSRGCVTLTRPNLKTIPAWRVLPCNLALPYVCEISPLKCTTFF